FSQTVGKNRGLEETIKAIGSLKNKLIHFTILGSCSGEMNDYLTTLAAREGLVADQLNFIDPVPLEEIFDIASKHHIGMAIETEATTNRQVCLTNKIFVYLLSGLAIAFTDTLAQKQFLQTNPGIGEVYPAGNYSLLATFIKKWFDLPVELNNCRKQ